MEKAPGLIWLVVVLDAGMADSQLHETFGPDSPRPYPYHILCDVTFGYFDNVWVTGKTFDGRKYVVVRLQVWSRVRTQCHDAPFAVGSG